VRQLLAALLLAGPALAQPLPGIGPADPRTPVDAHTAPWSSLGRVQSQVTGRCTGTLIAPDRVLTAAHCLVTRRTARFAQATSLRFLLGYDRGEAVVREVVSFTTGPGYDPGRPGPLGADWAILTLRHPLAGPTLPLWQAGIPPGTPLMLAGYQQGRGEVLLADTGCRAEGRALDPDGLPLLVHGCASTRGSSGAPLLARLPDGRVVVVGVAAAVERDAARGFAVPAESVR
jgi:protease YdgD